MTAASRDSCSTCARAADPELRAGSADPRLERAIGVIYRPETELASHYFDASLPQQFDAYLWFAETRAVTPLPTERAGGRAGHLSVRAVIARRVLTTVGLRCRD